MINCLKIKWFVSEKFKEKYKAFRIIKTDDCNIIEELPVMVYSVSYRTPNDFYVLTPANTSKEDVYRIFPEQHYAVSEVDSESIETRDLLTLIFNKESNTGLRYNNLSAELNIIHESKKDQKVCLTYSVSEDLILSCRVSTFSVLSDKTIKRFTYKTQKAISENKLTIYTADDVYVYRTSEKNIKKKYINRSISKNKNTLNFFSIDSSDNKVSEMFRILRRVNIENNTFIELGFEESGYQRIMEEKRSVTSAYQDLVNKTADDLTINVIDYCDRKEEITELFERNRIRYSYSDDKSLKEFNVAVIKSKEEYKESDETDKHQTSNTNILQNIIYKNLNDTVLKQCWLEMLIKREAITKDVTAVSLIGTWNFYKYINKKIHCLKIKDNHIQDLSSFSLNENAVKTLEEYKSFDPRMITEDEKGSILILNTDLRLLPDWDKITDSRSKYTVEKNGKKVNKIRTYRNEYFGEEIDINEFLYNGNKYYSVGEIGYGMNKTINNSPATKQVIEDGLTIRSIVHMLEPNIYQINKYAVYPYPFKLMDEIFVMNGGVIDEQGN